MGLTAAERLNSQAGRGGLIKTQTLTLCAQGGAWPRLLLSLLWPPLPHLQCPSQEQGPPLYWTLTPFPGSGPKFPSSSVGSIQLASERPPPQPTPHTSALASPGSPPGQSGTERASGALAPATGHHSPLNSACLGSCSSPPPEGASLRLGPSSWSPRTSVLNIWPPKFQPDNGSLPRTF